MSSNRTMRMKLFRRLAILILCAAPLSHAQPASRFDLMGPRVDVRVTRGATTLPIAFVPNLQAGDKLWLHPDLPPTQSVHYLLVVAFLRGTTNPPPDSWFTRIETWDKKVRAEGATVIVPDEAQQVILFLAPSTGGDFSTLRSAVQGRPGIFVRASQDLLEAGFEQARIDKYIASMRQVPPADPKALLDHSNLLARTLNLKPNEDCFKHPVDQQYACLIQTGSQTLLDDGHGQTIASMLTTGPNSDLIYAASATQLAGGGLYSAYVGAVVDLVRIMSGLHTAQYQYIPAIASPQQQSLNLRLNTPPSFHNPKSVIVIGLPSIQASTPPPLRPADPKQVTCLLKPDVTLDVEGAPLVFSTGFAHDLFLHLNTPTPTPDLRLTPDAYRGGLMVTPATARRVLPPDAPTAPASAATAKPAASDGELTGTITGFWGFDPFTGPTMPLQDVLGKDWKLVTGDPLIAGRDNHVVLSSTGAACIQTITADAGAGKPVKAEWKRSDDPAKVEVTLVLRGSPASDLHLAIKQFGETSVDTVATKAFSEPAKLDALLIHAGDSSAILRGTSLDEVKEVDLKGAVFTPASSAGSSPNDLPLSLVANTAAPTLRSGEKLVARISLMDGRTLPLPTTIEPARPSITLLTRNIQQPAGSALQLGGNDDLPLDQPLSFSLKSAEPFSRREQLEIASTDGSLQTVLSIATGSLVLQDPHTILAKFDPLKSFGTSAFGTLRMRAVATDGSSSDWLPLVTLVRLPTLTGLSCPADSSLPCHLSGSNLYLVDAISADSDFTNATTVPQGFIGNSIAMPHPTGPVFYLHLRDDPTAANPVTLPVQPE